MKKLILFVLILTLVLGLSACTKDTVADIDYVNQNGYMIIGYTVYEPMNYTDDSGTFTGFDTELAIAVCEKLGVAPEFVEINWDTKEVELSSKAIDCIWNGLTITPARQETMSITDPYVQNAQVVVMKADADYKDTSSLVGKTVCAEAGSAGEETIEGDENLQNAHYVAKEVQTACLMEVAAGTADAAVLDLTLAKAMIGPGTNYANLVIKDRLEVENYGVAFRKGSDLCKKVNGIFKDLIKDGTMEALAQKYGLDLAK
ncbi:MAG: transporter substrate-binding domain-containing protein [Chitinispirillales bacterium]|jgi:polar amino acid transport system substrate-binding protein|nr:transporter substrate-binding domain-containing protein [Chitinispirillales bacterium]